MKKSLAFFFTIFACSQLMCNDIAWSFPPTLISAASFDASDPQIAMDSSGNVVAAWVENGFVKASTKLVSGSWSTPVILSATGASCPRIVNSLSGNATAVWLESGIVKTATKSFGGSWSATTSLSSSGASCPDLAVDVAGDVVAVWARSGNIESSTKLFGGSWQTHVTITSTAATNPHVAIGGVGATDRAVVVWQGTVNSVNIVYAATKLMSGSWSTQQAISDTTHNASNAYVAVDGSSNATAVWYEYDVLGNLYSNVVVQSASRPASGIWSPPVSVSTPGIRNPADLVARVAFDANGNTIAVWSTSFDGESFDIQSATKPVRGVWTAPMEIINSLYSFKADLAVTSLGDALITYAFYNGSAQIIKSSEMNFSGFMQNVWSVPINVSQGIDNAFPRVAATLTGNVINAAIVWINFNGSHNGVQAVTGSRSVVLPPSSPHVTQYVNNFGVFSEYYNTLTWTASSDPNVVGYAVFRDGKFLQQVDASVLQINDDNRVQNGAVTYGVAAIDNQQSQSNIINVSFP